MNQLKEGVPEPTDLSADCEHIGHTHFNNIKSAPLDGSPKELKQEIRLDDRIKTLVKMVTARKGTQKRLRKEEKVTGELPHWTKTR